MFLAHELIYDCSLGWSVKYAWEGEYMCLQSTPQSHTANSMDKLWLISIIGIWISLKDNFNKNISSIQLWSIFVPSVSVIILGLSVLLLHSWTNTKITHDISRDKRIILTVQTVNIGLIWKRIQIQQQNWEIWMLECGQEMTSSMKLFFSIKHQKHSLKVWYVVCVG